MSPPLRPPVSIHEFRAWQRRVEELERASKNSAEWQETHGEEFEDLKKTVAGIDGKLDLILQGRHHANLKAGVWGGGFGSVLWLIERAIELFTKGG